VPVSQHVARLDVTPANMALQLHIDVSLNRPPDRTWRRPPGRPRNNWLDQLRNDSIRPTGDLWRRAVDLGHGGAMTRWASTMMMMMMMALSMSLCVHLCQPAGDVSHKPELMLRSGQCGQDTNQLTIEG